MNKSKSALGGKQEKTTNIALFEHHEVRRVWHEDQWWFSVIDVVAILTQSSDPRNYWKVLKTRLKQEGSELVTKCNQLKMMSSDGKYYSTDTANTEVVLRLIQSVPSPNAEPFKLWLARVGKERIEEIQDPELAMDRMRELYRKKGYPEDWIDKRVRGIAVRHTLTDEWQNRGAKQGIEYAILTDEIMQGAFDMKTMQYKEFKDLDKQNLRDHMNDMELILTMLAEASTTNITQARNSQGFVPLQKDAKEGGDVAGKTRKDIESRTGKKVSTSKNYLDLAVKKQISSNKK